MLGLAPNAARIAVRFYEKGSLGDYERNLENYLQDTKMVLGNGGMRDYLPPRSYRYFSNQMAAFGKAENVPDSVICQLMRAFVFGKPFPHAFYQLLIQRMRVDKGFSGVGSQKHDVIGYRAALIKACLVRARRIEAGGRWVELNDSKEIGYRLGRLFALLERAQAIAVPGINSTIRDRYMGAAAATPGGIRGNEDIPISVKIGKDKPGLRNWFDDRIGEVMCGDGQDVIRSFPATLDYEQQGLFYIGYYHQRASRQADCQTAANSKEGLNNEQTD